MCTYTDVHVLIKFLGPGLPFLTPSNASGTKTSIKNVCVELTLVLPEV